MRPCSALAVTAQPALAQSDSMFEFLSGGAPTGKRFSLFGMQEIPRSTVRFDGNHKPGTIVINTAERRLYYVHGDGSALRYGIGVGRVGFTWKGVKTVTEKKEWPAWTPPAQMLKRRPDLPRHMVGGIDNPLGARAMYLGSHALPHPRLERAGDDRPGGVVGLLPHDQRRRGRPLQSRAGRHDGDRAVGEHDARECEGPA